ncbi:MAG: hypothetical protein JJ891_06800 [Rhizobiaceae bacterium]|nr:hypothetical protein [Rhizobiaceae bacterium]
METKDKFLELEAALRGQISDMFYTPETREELENWLEVQPPQMPTGVALMVGFNYAMKQCADVLKDAAE